MLIYSFGLMPITELITIVFNCMSQSCLKNKEITCARCRADKHVDPTNYLGVKHASNDSQKNNEGNKGEITV